MSEDKLTEFLKTGGDWEKLKTSVPGVFIQKLPAFKSSPERLAVEINPVDASGNPTKRRGLLIRNEGEYAAFKKLLTDDKIPKLIEMLEAVNPGTRASAKKDEVIEL
jgi:hypothetical protein